MQKFPPQVRGTVNGTFSQASGPRLCPHSPNILAAVIATVLSRRPHLAARKRKIKLAATIFLARTYAIPGSTRHPDRVEFPSSLAAARRSPRSLCKSVRAARG